MYLVQLRGLALIALAACGGEPPPPASKPAPAPPPVTPPAPPPVKPAEPPDSYPDLASALTATIPADARVVGFGELHARTDRAQAKSALARFTDALPAFGDKVSDLIVETWIPPGNCQKEAEHASQSVAKETKRPVETKSEIAMLAEAARAKGVQPHAMRVTCDDFKRITAAKPDDQLLMLLELTRRELGRISVEAVEHRDREATHRPWIALYGGALHNDRFPDPAVAQYSYAPDADKVTKDHFVEVDLIVPEFAEADELSHKQPWFAVAHAADARFHVWKRGERSFVIVLPKSQ